MNCRTLFLVSALLAPISAFGQFPISLGLKVGSSLTDAFSDRTVTIGSAAARTYSPQRDFIIGPMLEVHLPMGVSVEGDALYRSLHLTAVASNSGGSFSDSRNVNSWEFPILLKYRMGFPIVKPFIEVGPSFRHVSEFPGDSPHLSAKGLAMGAGVEAHVLFIRVAPEFRYTHWGSDSNGSTSSFDPNSHANQVEFLVGISF